MVNLCESGDWNQHPVENTLTLAETDSRHVWYVVIPQSEGSAAMGFHFWTKMNKPTLRHRISIGIVGQSRIFFCVKTRGFQGFVLPPTATATMKRWMNNYEHVPSSSAPPGTISEESQVFWFKPVCSATGTQGSASKLPVLTCFNMF